jgi:hypothetical protein
MNQPQQLSNSIDDFVQSGIYPGGSGIVTAFHYQLWDYDGKQAPDSVCAVHLTLTPTDGSNENKPVEIYWSVGPASDFQPDHTGGFLLSSTRSAMSNSSNWADVNDRFKNTCGLDPAILNGPTGIRVMENGEMTLTTVDQKKRDNLNDDQPQEGGQKRKRTILVPTRFKGAWEKGGARRTAPTPAVAKPGPISVPTTTTAAPVSNNNGSFDVSSALSDIILEAGGVIPVKDIPKAMLNKLVGQAPTVRVATLTAVKAENLPAIAQSQGWTLDDGGNLSL